MRRTPAQIAGRAERELDQGLPACAFAEERAKNHVRKYKDQEDIYEASQQTGGLIYQRVLKEAKARA